jgi:hypothetical protein
MKAMNMLKELEERFPVNRLPLESFRRIENRKIGDSLVYVNRRCKAINARQSI